MAGWTDIFTKLFSRDVAAEASKTGKALAKADTEKIIQKTAVEKPVAVNTATKIYTTSGGESVLKTTARDIAGSKVVKTAGKAAAGTIIIGGAAYGLGALTGAGMQSVGYGWRDLTNAHTPQEQTAQDLTNRSKSQELDAQAAKQLQDFYKWAQANGYSDSPSVREAYDNYVKGGGTQGTQPQTQDQGSSISPWIYVAGAAAVGAGIYLLTKKKKGKK